jgi:hypothetical protein
MLVLNVYDMPAAPLPTSSGWGRGGGGGSGKPSSNNKDYGRAQTDIHTPIHNLYTGSSHRYR